MLKVGSGGLHSRDAASLYRSDADTLVVEIDATSFYPTMMAGFGLFPRSLGKAGLEEFRAILAQRLALKRNSGPVPTRRGPTA